MWMQRDNIIHFERLGAIFNFPTNFNPNEIIDELKVQMEGEYPQLLIDH